jgi:hypothetical protein
MQLSESKIAMFCRGKKQNFIAQRKYAIGAYFTQTNFCS